MPSSGTSIRERPEIQGSNGTSMGIPNIGADEYWGYIYLPLVIRND
jgi:hypothetical protein